MQPDLLGERILTDEDLSDKNIVAESIKSRSSNGDDNGMDNMAEPLADVAADNNPEESRSFFGGIIHSFKRAEGDQQILKQELSSFHVQMIAIGGSVGTGLFLGIGGALASGGPAALLICWALIGMMIFCTVQALGELAVIMPVPGAFARYSSSFLDESWGFAMGWNYAMSWMILLPLELSGCALTFQYWPKVYESVPNGALITIFFVLIMLANLLSVKYYGIAEVVCSLTKVIAVVAFLLFGIVMRSGGIKGVSFENKNYWKDPGPFSNGFPGVLSVFVTAAFSFSGTELVGLTAAESANPRKTVPKATKQVFWRICFFYFSSLIVIGLLVPYNHASLISNSENEGDSGATADASPFVIALSASGIKSLPSIMNCVILISIFSVGNSAIYAASRTLTSLAENGQAPLFLNYIDNMGRPLLSILVTFVGGLVAYISCSTENGAATLFTWLVSIAGLSSLFTWGSVCLCHIRFRAGLKSQGRGVQELPFTSQVGVIGSWFGFLFVILVLIAQIYNACVPIGMPFTATHFFQEILAIPIVLSFYLGHKIYLYCTSKEITFFVRASTMDLDTGRVEIDRDQLILDIAAEKEELASRPFWARLYKFLC